MRKRQVHLDFHTSEKIEGIGERFSREQFQQALLEGHVDSVTLFAKCHHGWSYYPAQAGEMHPHLKFDLLGEQIRAAQEIGVKTPVYLSAGLDERAAKFHPEWLVRTREGEMIWNRTFLEPGYHKLCLNSPYLEELLAQIKEVCERFDADGIFLDIVGVQPCYCRNCLNRMEREGLDPLKEEDVLMLAEKVYREYALKVREAVDSVKKGLPVFHNGGHIRRGRRDLAGYNTHLELESLPTGGWGYDHFPLSSSYARTLGMEYLGMTGKFHSSWGEFGGFKHPDALRYEAALAVAQGGGVSVGDQLHPGGEMDPATYRMIGRAYREVEEKEPWLAGAVNEADVALLSAEAVKNGPGMTKLPDGAVHQPDIVTELSACAAAQADTGAVRMLLEGHYLFDVIDCQADFSKYKVIILPDAFRLSTALVQKLRSYAAGGGKVLATGKAAWDGQWHQAVDFGIRFLGKNDFCPDYFRPSFPVPEWENTAFVMYSDGYRIENVNGREWGRREEPYFNRTASAFCSHMHTPDSGRYGGPGMVEGPDGIYVAWEVFRDYAVKGSLILKRMVCYALDRLLEGRKSLSASLPAQGVMTLTRQVDESRHIAHLLYASPVRRGNDIEVIEDVLPLYNISLQFRLKEPVRRVYLAPQMEELPFEKNGDVISVTVPEVNLHQMVVAQH